MNENFICPKCGYPQYCNCDTCRPHIPDGYLPYVVGEDEDIICANCGFAESISWWMDYAWDIAVEGGQIERPLLTYGVFVNWDGMEINYV